MQEEKKRIKERKNDTKSCVNRRKSKKNDSEIAIFKEPPYLLIIASILGAAGLGLVSIPVICTVRGHLDGVMLGIIGTAWFLLAMKVASHDERINIFFDPKRGVVRFEKASFHKTTRMTEFKRSDIAGARVTESYEECNTMYGAELLLKDGTTVPMAMCQTGGRGVWDKAVQVTNEVVLRRKPGKSLNYSTRMEVSCRRPDE